MPQAVTYLTVIGLGLYELGLVVVAVLDEVIPQTDDVGQVGFCMTYGVDGCI